MNIILIMLIVSFFNIIIWLLGYITGKVNTNKKWYRKIRKATDEIDFTENFEKAEGSLDIIIKILDTKK